MFYIVFLESLEPLEPLLIEGIPVEDVEGQVEARLAEGLSAGGEVEALLTEDFVGWR